MPNLPVDSSQMADLILANPAAGGGRASEMLPRLQKFAAGRSWHVETRIAGSLAEFSEIARLEAAQGRQRIFALGGDGTFQALLNAVFGNDQVTLGVLPAGGGNDFASALGLPLDAVEAAQTILDRGEIICSDAVRVRTADGVERLYVGGGGVGLDAEAAQYASGVYRGLRGRARYLLSAIRALWGFHPIQVRVSFDEDGRILEGSALVLGVLNTPSYGAGLRLAPGARIDDGILDLVMIEDLSLLEIAKVLSSLAVSGNIRTARMLTHSTRGTRIETHKPCFFHGDGEIIGKTPVEISVVPRAMRVWRAMASGPESAIR